MSDYSDNHHHHSGHSQYSDHNHQSGHNHHSDNNDCSDQNGSLDHSNQTHHFGSDYGSCRRVEANNYRFQRDLSNMTIVSRKQVFILSLISLILVFVTGGTWLYANHPKNVNPEGENYFAFAMFLSFSTLVLALVTLVQYRRYSATYGSIDLDSSHQNRVPWVSVSRVPNGSLAYSNNMEMFGTSIFLLAMAVATVVNLYYALGYLLGDPKFKNPDIPENTPVPLLVICSLALFVSIFLFVRAYKRHLYYQRFSRLPLETGVFTSDA